MPTILEFPPIHPEPEISLKNILNAYNITKFGLFGYWAAFVKIGSKDSWIKKGLSAKIDTGASISLFPASLKSDLNLGQGIPYTLYGVIRTQECKYDVELHQLDLELNDHLGQKLVFKDVWVALSKLEKTPILLGYKDLLQRCFIAQKPNSETLTLTIREKD